MSSILTSTGNGELEVMEFTVSGKSYGINVLKLKGIVQLGDVVGMPQTSGVIMGVSNIREEMVPIIDLKFALTGETSEIKEKALVLLCEFNGTSVAFYVDAVEGIRRLKWSDMKNDNLNDKAKITVGGFLIDGSVLLMLDFESIIMETSLGKSYIELKKEEKSTTVCADKYILFAEDSLLISEKIQAILRDVGYKNVVYFTNGKEAQDYLIALRASKGENFTDQANILISDIEMPVMDGYTLTKFVKSDPILKKLPVVFFSSLISDELYHKGQKVGADAQICKPSAKELVETIEKYILR